MSKKLLLPFLLFFLFGMASAFPKENGPQNIMMIPDIVANAGEVITIELEVENDEDFVGFNLDIPLPEGFEYIDGSQTLHRGVDHILSFSIRPGNIARMISISFTNSAFQGNEGVLVSFDVQTPDQAGEYDLQIVDAILGDINAEDILTETIDGTVTLVGLEYDLTFNVVDENGAAIDDATVTLDGEDNAPGVYVFTDLPTGDYDYAIAAEGYQVATGTVSIVDQDVTETVELLWIRYVVTFGVDGSGGLLNGEVSGAGIVSGEEVVIGSDVLFTAMPDPGYQVKEWHVNGELVTHDTNGDDPLTATEFLYEDIDKDIEVTLKYELIDYVLTIIIQPEGAGDVSIDPEKDFYNVGEMITLTATASEGYVFQQWRKDGSGIGNQPTLEYVMPADDVTIRALFVEEEIELFSLVLEANPVGAGALSGDGNYEEDEEVLVVATANFGYHFLQWKDEDDNHVSDQASFTYNMPGADITLTAFFGLNDYEINAMAVPLAGGVVDGAGTYDHGATVTLTATASEGYEFVNWQEEGNILTDNPILSFIAEADRDLEAHFQLITYDIVFVVEDQDGEAINHAVITLDGEANDAGDYLFSGRVPGTYSYTVTAEGYDEVSGEIILADEDVTEHVVLTLITYTVSFEVLDEDDQPVGNAVISFGGVANPEGDYVFEGIAPGEYEYSVMAEGYAEFFGNIDVVDNVTVTVVLMEPVEGNTMMTHDVIADAGETITIEIEIRNQDEFVGFGVDIPMPPGFTYVNGSAQLFRSVNHTLSVSVLSGNILRLSSISGNLQVPYLGQSGVILSFDVIADEVPGFYSLPLNNPYMYNVGMVDILDEAIPGIISLEGDVLPVTFTVTDDSVDQIPVDAATITIGSMIPVHTDQDGVVVMNLADGDYVAHVQKDGYVTQEVNFTVEGEPKDVHITLPLQRYTVSFNVVGEDGQAIDDAIVTFDGHTNPAGNYVFEDVLPGDYEYSVVAEAYVETSDTVTVLDEDLDVHVSMTLKRYTVSFDIVGEDEETIDDAIVTFDGHTNPAGNYVFEDVLPGDYEYSVVAEAYVEATGTLTVVDEDIVETVILEEKAWNVTFHVKEDSNDEDPIAGATITVNGEELTTDGEGLASISLLNGTYTANIVAGGYVSEEIEFVVDGGDKDIEVHLLDVIVAPFDLEVITEGYDPGEALFQWSHSNDKAFMGFDVYLNDEFVDQVAETQFFFTDLPAGEHVAGVRSVYTTGMSDIITIGFEVEPDLFEVTFNVELTKALQFGLLEGFDPDIHHIFMTGSMFGWAEPGSDPDQTMEHISDDPHIYSLTMHLEAGTYEYKYFSDLLGDGWDGGEWPGDPNRVVEVTGDMTVDDMFGPDDLDVLELDEIQVVLYPNPTRHVLNIESNTDILELRMLDMLGQVVLAAPVDGMQYQINVSEFNTGIYFIQMTTRAGMITHRVQVAR